MRNKRFVVAYADGANPSGLVQTTSAPTSEQLHPPLTLDRPGIQPMKGDHVAPFGTANRTATGPTTGSVPRFVTRKVYCQ